MVFRKEKHIWVIFLKVIFLYSVIYCLCGLCVKCVHIWVCIHIGDCGYTSDMVHVCAKVRGQP